MSQVKKARASDPALAHVIHPAQEQRDGGHHHAGQTIAALPGLFGQKRRLQGVRRHRCSKPFNRYHLAPGHRVQADRASIGRLAVQQHHAGTALFSAAAKASSSAASKGPAQAIGAKRATPWVVA